jgi:3-methyl-2-oxobutanoate hydroxymethyltransferase
MISEEVSTPTIGIGAGPACDGQILVIHDLIGFSLAPAAKFVRQYADVGAVIKGAVEAYKRDVEAGGYPADNESYHLSKETQAALEAIAERKRAMRK